MENTITNQLKTLQDRITQLESRLCLDIHKTHINKHVDPSVNLTQIVPSEKDVFPTIKKFEMENVGYKKNILVIGDPRSGRTTLVLDYMYNNTQYLIGDIFIKNSCDNKYKRHFQKNSHTRRFHEVDANKFSKHTSCIHEVDDANKLSFDQINKTLNDLIYLDGPNSGIESYKMNCFYPTILCKCNVDEELLNNAFLIFDNVIDQSEYNSLNIYCNPALKLTQIYVSDVYKAHPTDGDNSANHNKFKPDFIFICNTSNISSIKNMYDDPCTGISELFNSYEVFCKVVKKYTKNYGCIVIDNTIKSQVLEERVFWYSASILSKSDKNTWTMSSSFVKALKSAHYSGHTTDASGSECKYCECLIAHGRAWKIGTYKIGTSCIQTYPCRHLVINDKCKEYEMCGDQLYNMLENSIDKNSEAMAHFKCYQPRF